MQVMKIGSAIFWLNDGHLIRSEKERKKTINMRNFVGHRQRAQEANPGQRENTAGGSLLSISQFLLALFLSAALPHKSSINPKEEALDPLSNLHHAK